jgi:hypothetical protein
MLSTHVLRRQSRAVFLFEDSANEPVHHAYQPAPAPSGQSAW